MKKYSGMPDSSTVLENDFIFFCKNVVQGTSWKFFRRRMEIFIKLLKIP